MILDKKTQQRICNLKDYVDSEFGGKTIRLTETSNRSAPFYYDLLKGKKSFGEKLARQLEKELNLPENWLDKPHPSPDATLPSDHKTNNYKYDEAYNCITKPSMYWSEFVHNYNDLKVDRFSSSLVGKSLNVCTNAFFIEIDVDLFHDFTKGYLLLIDPNSKPKKGNVIIVSFDDETPSLARFLPGFGELLIEPLESGYNTPISLKDKDYTIHGIIIWAQPRGYQP